MSNSEALSTEQSTATTQTTSYSSGTLLPTSTSDDGNSSQTVADTTTTTSSVSDSESTPSNSVSYSSTATTNNDDLSSSLTSTDTTTVSTSTSVTFNSSPEIPPTSTTSESTIEGTSTDATTVETTPTSTFTEVTTATTSESTNTSSTSVESQTTTSGDVETTSTTATISPTTVTGTTSETSATVSEQPTTVSDTTSETSTTATEQPTTVTDTTSATSTTVTEQSTTVIDTTSETSITATEQPTTVTDTTSQTFTTVTEQSTAVTDTTSPTSTAATEQSTTVTDTTSPTSTTVTEQSTTVTDTTSPTSTAVSTSATSTDTSTVSSSETSTESQTLSGSPTETQIVTITRTESETTTQTETFTLSVTQTRTESSSDTQSGLSASQSGLGSGSGLTAAGSTTVFSGASTPSSLVLSVSADTLTDVNTSDLDILTQNSLPTAQPLSLSSIDITYTTTEFATSTLSDGKVTTIPTLTRTVSGTGKATYTLQPNEIERNKGAIVGIIVAAIFLAIIGILVGICLCRRRRRRVAGRRDTLSPFGDVTTSRVLIPGHPPLAGDRLLNNQQWRPPLAGEVAEDEDDTVASRNGMSEMRSVGGSILPVAYQDRPTTPPPRESVEVTSLASSGQDSAMQFGTSLLSFDGPQQKNVTSRFSESSSMEGGVRTASLISLSAEPTPIESRFSNASSTSGTIPIISPFADSFSTQEAARNSYWGTSTARPSTPQSSLSGDRPAPKRSDSMGSQMSGHAQSITGSEQGWQEIEIEDPVPRPPGRASAPLYDVVVPAVNPFEMEATPSLMSQVSLLNPPARPSFHTTLTELIHQSRPPTLPEIPAVASPALTEDSFHPEGLLADHAYAQSRSESYNASRASLHSLLDHVDYSRPITESPRQSMSLDSDINFRMSRETGSSIEEGEFESSENPFEDPVDEDLCNDVSPVLTMLQRGTYSKISLVSTRT